LLIPARNYYRNIFLRSVLKSAAFLNYQKKYNEAELLYENALKFDPFDEDLNYMYINILAKQKKQSQSIKHIMENIGFI